MEITTGYSELDNTYKWEDCYGDEVLIPENQRTEDGNSPKEQLASLVKGGSNAKGLHTDRVYQRYQSRKIQKSLQSMEQTRKYVRLILMEKVESENG